MKTRIFRGDGKPAADPVKLPRPGRLGLLGESRYMPDEGLVDAVNVALVLGQPLLLTGEPGTGKTQLAHYLAWELGLGKVLEFETKSTSTATSLFYTYDSLRRFQDAQARVQIDSALPYITYNALGRAILMTQPRDDVARWLPGTFVHDGPVRSVVLIDEVDKAPRDFPNDILNELDRLFFRVPEIDNEPIRADVDHRPIVIITSNSEKDLPDAFLRRCIFYNIPFPARERMTEIIASRLHGNAAAGSDDALITLALELFYKLREPGAGLVKKPATAELLDWLITLRHDAANTSNPLADRKVALKTVACLVKRKDDMARAIPVIEQWANSRT